MSQIRAPFQYEALFHERSPPRPCPLALAASVPTHAVLWGQEASEKFLIIFVQDPISGDVSLVLIRQGDGGRVLNLPTEARPGDFQPTLHSVRAPRAVTRRAGIGQHRVLRFKAVERWISALPSGFLVCHPWLGRRSNFSLSRQCSRLHGYTIALGCKDQAG